MGFHRTRGEQRGVGSPHGARRALRLPQRQFHSVTDPALRRVQHGGGEEHAQDGEHRAVHDAVPEAVGLEVRRGRGEHHDRAIRTVLDQAKEISRRGGREHGGGQVTISHLIAFMLLIK